jgi:hypothetical protein
VGECKVLIIGHVTVIGSGNVTIDSPGGRQHISRWLGPATSLGIALGLGLSTYSIRFAYRGDGRGRLDAACPGPGVGRWDKLESVLWIPVIQFVRLSEEGGTLPAPASVALCLAQHAVSCEWDWAIAHPMFHGAVAACVFILQAVPRKVVPSLTLQASCQLPFDSFDVASSVTDVEAVSDGSVRCISIREGEGKVCCPLIWRAKELPSLDSLLRRHPRVRMGMGVGNG